MRKNKTFLAGHSFAMELLTYQPSLTSGILEKRGTRQFIDQCKAHGISRPALPSFIAGCRAGYFDFHQVAL